MTQAEQHGLNPFDIRASVRTHKRDKFATCCVSIPLISGHQSGLFEAHSLALAEGLNPFDIRASVRTRIYFTTTDGTPSQSL